MTSSATNPSVLMATAHEQVIEEYIQNPDNQPLSVAKFLNDNLDYLVSNTTLRENYKNKWTGFLNKVAAKNNMKLKKSFPDWNAFASSLLEHLSKNDSSSAQPLRQSFNSSGSNSSSSHRLSTEDRQQFVEVFDNTLSSTKFWTLTTGTVVEQKMKELALKCTHEHPCLSMVLDPADSIWNSYFTVDELEEIEHANKPMIRELPTEAIDYSNNYKNMKTLDELWEESAKHHFHPIRQPLMNWVHMSVVNTINILFHNIHKKYKTEADLMKRIWVMIDCAFDDSDVDVICGEYVSKSTTTRANMDRSIAAIDAMARRKIGTKTDVLFTTEFLEFGTCEAGKITDPNNTKTLLEAGMKIPKTLKDMLFVLANECPSQLRRLRTCGIVISGLNMLPLLMDSPNGYVARISRPNQFLHYPTNASDFYKNMKNILRVIYDVKTVMAEVNEIINETDDGVKYGSRRSTALPPSFLPVSVKRTSKKRKAASETTESS
ncbi:hypothetical protein BDA99DRAFT_602267 [Phascolomyces articulosus]|uniref:Uncharacterized protein n=1 Tax=Phascolomyces articulosus TaxID=60185 RepID=A0AAD5K7V3_9FUNG|nr:hypothetical protein BDA99DRAFT_602267 [Phascolomyces articulosus]